jgi:hypothetical protein
VWYEIDASMFAEPVSTSTGNTNLGQDYKTFILPDGRTRRHVVR